VSKLLREPFLHFLVLGFGLFVLFELVAEQPRSSSPTVIEVDQAAVLAFIRSRSRDFDQDAVIAQVNALSDEAFDHLVADVVREEALYREALKLGLDENDDVIRSRLIQTLEFLSTDLAPADAALTEEDIAAYYNSHREDYFVEPTVTFTHVFLSAGSSEREARRLAATGQLQALNELQVPFERASFHGEAVLHSRNYVARSADFIASHFGEGMTEKIFGLEPDSATWRGPFASPDGFHLVLVTDKVEGRYYGLDEIPGAIRRDATQKSIDKRKEEAVSAIVDTYEVRRKKLRPFPGAAE